MTIKTLFIAPYPAMSHLIEECRKEEPELEVRVEVGNLLKRFLWQGRRTPRI